MQIVRPKFNSEFHLSLKFFLQKHYVSTFNVMAGDEYGPASRVAW